MNNCFVIVKKDPHSIFGISTTRCTKLLSFHRKTDATKCTNMMANYKKKYGYWPVIHNAKIRHISRKNTQKSLDTILQEIEIQYAETDELVAFCNMHNIGMIFCEEFSVEDSNLHFKGTQFEPPNNIDTVVQYLETLV